MVAGIIKICIVLSLTVATPIKQIPLTKKVIDVGIYVSISICLRRYGNTLRRRGVTKIREKLAPLKMSTLKILL